MLRSRFRLLGMVHGVGMGAGDPDLSAQCSREAVAVLVKLIRRHIDRLRTEEVTHLRSVHLLRQYRGYGYGLIGMLAGYCDEIGVNYRNCVELALELEDAISDAARRALDVTPANIGPAGVRRAVPRRKPLIRQRS